MPNPDGTLTEAELAEIHKRRQLYADHPAGTPMTQADANNPNFAWVSEEQNTADVNAENADNALRAQLPERARIAGNYANPSSGPGAYTNDKGEIVNQGGGLPGLAGALVDPNSGASQALDYGGKSGYAASEAERLGGIASSASTRPFIQADRGQSDQTRGEQFAALGLHRSAALGEAPSVAEGMFQSGLDRGMASNMSLANSARGGSLALAQGRLSAIGQNAGMVAGGAAQASQLRAQEMAAARAGYSSAAQGIRGQDIGAADANATFALGSQGQNDAQRDAFERMKFGVNQAQMQGQQGRTQDILGANGVTVGAQTANAALQAQNQAHSENNTAGYVATGAGVLTGIGGVLLGGLLGGSSGKGANTENTIEPGGSGGSSPGDILYDGANGSGSGGASVSSKSRIIPGQQPAPDGIRASVIPPRPTLSPMQPGMPARIPSAPPPPTPMQQAVTTRPYKRYW